MLFRRGIGLAVTAMAEVDLLVLLPLNPIDGIGVPEDEDTELRAAMDAALFWNSRTTRISSYRRASSR